MIELAGGIAGAMLDHFLQHADHDACGSCADHVSYLGVILFQHAAIVIGDFANVARYHAHPVIGKGGECGSLFREVRSAAPSATGRYAGSGEVMPNLRTYSMTVLMPPTRSVTFSAGMLRDSARACRKVITPSNLPS